MFKQWPLAPNSRDSFVEASHIFLENGLWRVWRVCATRLGECRRVGESAQHGSANVGESAQHGSANVGESAQHGSANVGESAQHGSALARKIR